MGAEASRAATASENTVKSPPAAAICAPKSAGVNRAGIVTCAITCRTSHFSHSDGASHASAGAAARRSASPLQVGATQDWGSVTSDLLA